jgi:mono/diheme cytochrome c family protein
MPVLAVAFAILAALVLASQAKPESPAPQPAAAPATGSAERGRKLFVQSCTHCHGDDGHGDGEDGDGPDLSRIHISDTKIGNVIRSGIAGEMPAFSKKYDAADISDLTAYLHTLR